MSDRLLKKYVGRNAGDNSAVVDTAAEVEPIDDLGAFGWLRGIRDRALMLELRKKDGSIAAFGYYMLEKVAFEPPDGITLYFGGQAVKLTGRNLGGETRPGVRLLHGIMRHRVPWITEADEPTLMLVAGKSAVVVEDVKW